ncbi:MAG: hypothetical protein V3R29_12265 [Candidatus Acidoferrales bacterium]
MLYSKKEATIEHFRVVDLHGLPFFDIYYKYTDELDPQTQLARVQGEMVYSRLQVGDRVLVEKIANTVMRIERL